MSIDNAFYDDLGERWYTAADDPVALLRAESRLRTGWLLETLRTRRGGAPQAILDVGCGGGFLANALAEEGHEVTGIDLAPGALAVARRHDATRTVTYLTADARHMPFGEGRFDVVCAMDFLEHLAEREGFLDEVARVLRPGGLFFFHTFNRNLLSHLVVIKGVEWFVRNTPKDMHVIELFLEPAELRDYCTASGLTVDVMRGVRPRILQVPMLRLLVSGSVDPNFKFLFTRSLALGYCGFAHRSF